MYQEIHESLVLSSRSIEANPARFFKTGPGTYGAHDQFMGLNAKHLKDVAKKYPTLDMVNLSALMHSPFNEERLLGIYILLLQQKKANTTTQAQLYDFYLQHIDSINNWNLVDASAHLIIGEHCFSHDNYHLLYDFAKHEGLWKRRIAIVSSLYPIKKKVFTPTLEITEILLQDQEDLIHKACGWMLREIGKRQQDVLTDFLSLHASKMPRTMLRYAIERLTTPARQKWLAVSRIKA